MDSMQLAADSEGGQCRQGMQNAVVIKNMCVCDAI
jgi:hypothetical protein